MASLRETARPMPRDPPVTTATRPAAAEAEAEEVG